MCYPDVVAGTGEIYGKLALFAHKHIDGHAPGLSGKALAAYAAAGIETEHECTSFAEAKEKLAAGLAILVREGSAAKNLTAIVEGLLKEGLPTDRFLFCTDDKHLDDIAREGHIRWNVHQAVQLGMPVVDAICMASYNGRAGVWPEGRGGHWRRATGRISCFWMTGNRYMCTPCTRTACRWNRR